MRHHQSVPRPPWLARCLLWLMLGRVDRRTVTDDLREMYEARRARLGEPAAAEWWRRQWRQYPSFLLAERFRRPRGGARRPGRRSASPSARRQIIADLRHSLRSLRRTPVVTAAIVLTVGLGIGATTAVLGVIRAVVIEPLPYRDSDQIVRVYTDSPPDKWPLSVADYRALREQQTSFSLVAGYYNSTATFSRDDVTERVDGKFVTATYFRLLGLTPLHGRVFTEGDGAPGREATLVVSHRFWMRHLGGRRQAIGEQLRLDGLPYTLVGVLPPGVGPFEQNKDFFAAVDWGVPPRKGPFFITALARLAPGVDRAVAREELRAINRRLFPVWQDSYQDARVSWDMQDVKELVVGDVGSRLAILLGAVALVLLIASTNAANLLVARATQRGHELAVRAALGASRGRLVQHLLAEAVVLTLASAAVGLIAAAGGLRLAATVGADFIPRAAEVGMDATTGWILAALALGSSLLFGVVPSLHGARPRTALALRSQSRSATESAGARRVRKMLVVAEFAIAAPLLVGAGLLVVTLANLQRVDPGLATRNLLTAAVSLPASDYPEDGHVRTFWEDAHSSIEALPGVEGVVSADGRPPGQFSMTNNFDLLDRPTPPNEAQPTTPWVGAAPGYFDLLGIPLLDGRVFTDEDDNGPPVAIVDEAWARRFYPGESPLGRRFYSGGATTDPFTVIGVVGNVKHRGLDAPDEGTVYWPLNQASSRFRFLVIRTGMDPAGLVPSLRAAIRGLDATLPVTDIATMDELFGRSLATPRSLTMLVGVFAGLAVLLSSIGIYGVMSYFVQQRRREIGIRIALGGHRASVARLVVGQGMRLVLAGALAGLGAAWFLTRFMSGVLFGVGSQDPFTFAAASTLLLGIALAACIVPARRAAALDPARTLRDA